MILSRPKLASGKKVRADANGPQPRLSAGVLDTDDAPLPRAGAAAWSGTKIAVSLLVAFLALGAAIAAILAATVLAPIPTDGERVLVLRNAYPVGQVPAGAQVYVAADPAADGALGKIYQAIAGVRAGSVVEVVAGPAATVTTDPQTGEIIADGTPTGYYGQVAPRDLGRQYVAICHFGACDLGEAVLVDQQAVIGEAKGFVTLSGVTAVPAPPTQSPTAEGAP